MTIYSQKISNDNIREKKKNRGEKRAEKKQYFKNLKTKTRKEVYNPYLPLRIENKINKGKYVYYVSLL